MDKSTYNIIVDYSPSEADNNIVREGLISIYENAFGERDKPVSIFLKDETGKICGGIQAFLDTESIYIDIFWVEENHRNKGNGSRLLKAAEQEAIKRNCKFSLVDTWDFQAEDFYLKCGYSRIGELKDYWHSHSKIFLRKNLKDIS